MAEVAAAFLAEVTEAETEAGEAVSAAATDAAEAEIGSKTEDGVETAEAATAAS